MTRNKLFYIAGPLRSEQKSTRTFGHFWRLFVMASNCLAIVVEKRRHEQVVFRSQKVLRWALHVPRGWPPSKPRNSSNFCATVREIRFLFLLFSPTSFYRSPHSLLIQFALIDSVFGASGFPFAQGGVFGFWERLNLDALNGIIGDYDCSRCCLRPDKLRLMPVWTANCRGEVCSNLAEFPR